MTGASLSELAHLCAPPPGTRPRGAEVWARVQQRMGTTLPGDYRALVDEYGLVGVDDEVWVFQPEDPISGMDLACRAAGFDEFLAARPLLQRAGFRAHPRAGGLLPCGYTAGASLIAWKTGEAEDKWPLVLLERDGVEFECFGGGIVDFFVALMNGRRFDTILPDDWPTRPVLSYRSSGDAEACR